MLLYCLCWVGIALTFSYSERYKATVEEKLTSLFDRPVQIDALETHWVGTIPCLNIKGFKVASDLAGATALSFDQATVMVSPLSLLAFWPRFTEFVIEKPSIEVVTLPNNRLQIAGITLSGSKGRGVDRERLLSWLLEQDSAAWHQGEIRWRKSDGTVQRYSDISFVYDKSNEIRVVKGTISAPKGALAAKVEIQGNPLSSQDWDAKVELIDGDAKQWIKPGDLSFTVEDGRGKFRLAQLNIDLIRDFLSLSGLAEKTRWILDAQLAGVLHDVNFDFSGALLDLRDWSLSASATDVAYRSVDSLPALNNLSGELRASAGKGSFTFEASDSVFDWNDFYDNSFPINEVSGRFTWQIDERGDVSVSLHQAKFTDPNLSIDSLNVDLTFERRLTKVSSFGELFKVDSLQDLDYSDGNVIVAETDSGNRPVKIDASANFKVPNMSGLYAYLPKVKKFDAFRNWLTGAYKTGKLSNGRVSYRGRLASQSMKSGDANLRVSSDFDSVTVDYAPKNDWPPVTNGKGSFTLENDFLTVVPEELKLNGDPVTNGLLTIEDLFSRDILLKLRGKTTTSLDKGLAFVFQGPLIKKENRPKTLPVQPQGGQVDIDVSLSLPLNKVSAVKVNGTSTIRNGKVLLTEGVPLSDLEAVVSFTEKRVTSDDIRAVFLDGEARAKLTTTAETAPPKMRLTGSGLANLESLTPWVGEHLMTWFSGQSEWQGSVDFDGTNIVVNGESDLAGVTVSAPEPLAKLQDETASFRLFVDLGGTKVDGQNVPQRMQLEYDDLLRATFQAAKPNSNISSSNTGQASLFDRALVEVGQIKQNPSTDISDLEGVHFKIDHPELNVDELLESVIDLASFEPSVPTENTDFLDALRSVSVKTPNAVALSRPFGALEIRAESKDGLIWNGDITGDNVAGALSMRPRADVGYYGFDLSRLVIGAESDNPPALEPIDKSLRPVDYPAIKLTVDSLRMDGRNLGALDFYGEPKSDKWSLEKFALVHNGIRTTATGGWVNDQEQGSLTAFNVSTAIDEAEGVLTDMDFDGYVKKGNGSLSGLIEWRGAPHEFDYSRLNGRFDLFVKDGELVQVEPGTGKLLGLLNFNAIARRLVFDFRDLFASGLQFDRMRYRGLFANGKAILQDAYILTPAVFVRMEGKLDLDKELIDMDVHISPELGGNLTLLSALANPTAGAVVFITSQLFKDDMRRASFVSYQAKGTWKDFEMVEIDSEGVPLDKQQAKSEQSETRP